MRTQLIRFGIVGTVGVAINLAVFMLCTRQLQIAPTAAAVVAFSVAVTSNFTFNRIWSFAPATSQYIGYWTGWIRYVVVNCVGLGVNLLVLSAVIGWIGHRYAIEGQALGVASGMMFNFFMARALIFRPDRGPEPAPLSAPRSPDAAATATPSGPSYVAIFAAVVVAGVVVAVAFHAALGHAGYGYPWNTFLFTPADRYNDWHNSVVAASTFDPYYQARPGVLSVYFPFAYLAFLVGSGLSWAASSAVYLVISIGLLVAAVAFSWSQARPVQAAGGQVDAKELALLLLACVLSYPVLFALDRGNLDVWIGSLCAFYVAALNTRHERLGFAALCVAIAFKGYPAAFLGLALAERKWGSPAMCLAGALALTTAALASLDGGIVRNVHGFLANLSEYQRVYVLGTASQFATADPYSGIRSAARIVSDASPGATDFTGWFLRVYSLLSLACALLGAFFVLAVPCQRWRRVMAISLIALLFPNVANDYKLCILLPGILTLVLEEDRSGRGFTALALSCLLMIPKSYFFFAPGTIGISNLINPLLLLALVACVAADREAWRAAARRCRLALT